MMMERRFLVRKQNNRIEGPFSRMEVLDQLESGQLANTDEIAPSGAYWFQCHEGKEVERWIGAFEREKTVIDSDEMTLTMNRNVSDLQATQTRDGNLRGSLAPDVDDGFQDEKTDPMLKDPAGGSSAYANPTLKSAGRPNETFRIEGPSYWKWIALVLIPLVSLVIYRVLGLARFF